ncbi:hypothetical protein BV20DRAFT_597692 [Pilatotrama ljubarskyi]|nr:hypothetical protein BV20DRAFT_597692 [Pilatotrama ljubarskyi]
MLSLPRPAGREYTDRGVQTEPVDDEGPPSAFAPTVDRVESTPEPKTVQPPAKTSPDAHPHSRSSTQFDSAYSHDQTDISFDSMSSEANQSMTTTSRAYKRDQLPLNRPSTLPEGQSSSRVFSLPEATPKFNMKKVLKKKATRVVSMPGSTPGIASDSLDISTHAGDPFGSDGEEHTRVRVKSQATDVPYTPSAPSSPDSVVIIANNSNQLSTDFLRPRPDDLSCPESDDEEWLTWSESPPRPIPALHGPLSLPYARCPSGAEGTIIEEPDSMPRVIWGLDPDNTKTSRRSQDARLPHHASKTPVLPSDPTDRTKSKQQPNRSASEVSAAVTARDAPQAQQSAAAGPTSQQRPQPPEFMLKHSEPIDLGRLVGNKAEATHYTSTTAHAQRNTSFQSPFQHQVLTPELVHDLSPELQAMLFAQERLRNQGLSPPVLGTPSDTNGLLTPSWSTGSALSLLESLKSSRSPIILDDLAAPCGSYSQDLSSQMSALGLAQKYRQQQFQHGLLPTPPSSTSPIWASTFSPYQGGLLSPELLAAAGLSQLHSMSQLNPNYLSSQALLPRLDSSQPGLKSSSDTTGNLTLGARRTDTTGLAPPVQISNGSAYRLPPRLAAECARRRAGQDGSIDGQQPRNNAGRRFSSPVRGVVQSPVVPKPPPNTPYGGASSYAATRLDYRSQDSGLAAPPSPTSPSDSLGLPQHARSVPLSRLMHRRLSIVPEEDYASSAENGWTQSTKARAHAGGARGDASGLHLYLSASSRSNTNPASLSTLGGTAAQYGTDDTTAAAGKIHNVPASVKIPGVPGFGPGGRGEAQAVKEVGRRQGSGNVQKDGGQRSDGGRGRWQKRGGRGRRGRGGGLNAGNNRYGAERVDGGMMVKS